MDREGLDVSLYLTDRELDEVTPERSIARAALLERRGAGYAQADLAVDTEGRAPADVEATILERLRPSV